MPKLQLPHVLMPEELVSLLKQNLSITTSAAPVFDSLRAHRALYMTLESAFSEFDDGRGLEKTMLALGWDNFRDRFTSLYIYKKIHGFFPKKTSMELVEEIIKFETRFREYSVQSNSRAFLLGFYFRLANIQTQDRENNQFLEMKVSPEIEVIIKLSQGRTEKIDWLILIVMHLLEGLGSKILINGLITGKKFDELYPLLTPDLRKKMSDNLLAYGASICEPDLFVYEKI